MPIRTEDIIVKDGTITIQLIDGKNNDSFGTKEILVDISFNGRFIARVNNIYPSKHSVRDSDEVFIDILRILSDSERGDLKDLELLNSEIDFLRKYKEEIKFHSIVLYYQSGVQS